MLRILAVISVLLALGSGGAYYALFIYDSKEVIDKKTTQAGSLILSGQETPAAPQTVQETIPEVAPSQNSLRIVATGDITAHETTHLRAKKGAEYDYSQFFSGISEYLQGDIVVCTQDGPSAGEELGITGFPIFNNPLSFTTSLESIGCNAINLATNNIGDKGESGILKTLTQWKKSSDIALSGINESAADQLTVDVIQVAGVKVAYVAFTEKSNVAIAKKDRLNIFSESLVKTLLTEANASADYVVVSAHWGEEGKEELTASQKKWAKLLNEQGADIVFGSGAGTVQSVETLINSNNEKTLVYYGLGNTLSTQLKTNDLIGGIAIVEIPLGSTEQNSVASFLPTYVHYEWTAAEKAAGAYTKRTNLGVHPLATSEPLFKKSQLGTSASTQMDRVTKIITAGSSGVQIVSPTGL